MVTWRQGFMQASSGRLAGRLNRQEICTFRQVVRSWLQIHADKCRRCMLAEAARGYGCCMNQINEEDTGTTHERLVRQRGHTLHYMLAVHDESWICVTADEHRGGWMLDEASFAALALGVAKGMGWASF